MHLEASQPSTPQKHVIITGTGRAGTTFLVQLLTHLGLDTGYRPEELEQRLDRTARAGLEIGLKNAKNPYIVKMPSFCDQADELLQRPDLLIERVIVPMRDLEAAAESRRFVTRQAHAQWSPWKRFIRRLRGKEGVPGGVSLNRQDADQESVLLRRIYNLSLALSDTQVPVTLLRFPRLVQDEAYLFKKLAPLMAGISPEHFHAVFQKVARPDLVHSFNPKTQLPAATPR